MKSFPTLRTSLFSAFVALMILIAYVVVGSLDAEIGTQDIIYMIWTFCVVVGCSAIAAISQDIANSLRKSQREKASLARKAKELALKEQELEKRKELSQKNFEAISRMGYPGNESPEFKRRSAIDIPVDD